MSTQDVPSVGMSYVTAKAASNALQEKLLQNAVDLLDDAAKVKARTIIEGMAIAKISIKLAKEMRERT